MLYPGVALCALETYGWPIRWEMPPIYRKRLAEFISIATIDGCIFARIAIPK